jgi:hypothetical protein
MRTRLPSKRWWLPWPLALGTAACQLVAGIETRNVDPLLPGCTLPSDGAARIRVVNLFASDQNADFCIRPSGGAFKRPVLRGGGTDCAAGYAYEDVSAPFAAPEGSIDVKAIPAGQTCSAPATSEVDGVAVSAPGPVMTFVRMGGAQTPETLVATPETTAADTASIKLRFVHAGAGAPPLYLSVAADARLPTTLTNHILADAVPYGAFTTPSSHTLLGTMDPNGYDVLPNTEFALGAGAQDSNALLAATLPQGNAVRTLFVVGDTSNGNYPLRGLFCDDGVTDSTGLKGTCHETALATLSVDVFNAQLYGGGSPWEGSRRPYIQTAIAQRTSDVQCILELSDKADRDAVIQAALQSYPYSATLDTDMSTPFTDPTDQNGATPAPPAAAPCAPPVDQTAVNNLYQCISTKCSSTGDATGILAYSGSSTPSDCLSKNCLAQILPLYAGNVAAKACSDCVVVNAVSLATYADAKTSCTTDTRAAFAFKGQTPSMILSRYPLKNVKTYVLPSTLWRRVAYYAQVQLEQGKTVDFYCAQLTSPGNSQTLPYTGNYGFADVTNGYHYEQLLQAQRFIAWVKQTSGSSPAIIAIDHHASTQYPVPVDDAGAGACTSSQVLCDSDPDVVVTLRGGFQEAVPTGYVPQCTQCPRNVYNGPTIPPLAWLDVFTLDFAAQPATEVNVFADQSIVPLPDGTTGPLAATYGYNVRLIRP